MTAPKRKQDEFEKWLLQQLVTIKLDQTSYPGTEWITSEINCLHGVIARYRAFKRRKKKR